MDAPPQPITGLGQAPSYYLVPQLSTSGTAAAAAVATPAAVTARPLLTMMSTWSATTSAPTTTTTPAANDPTAEALARVVTVTAQQLPSLVATKFAVAPVGTGPARWGGTLQVSAEITNQTLGTVSPPTRARIVVVPQGQDYTSANAVTIGNLYFPGITGSAPATQQGTVYLPGTPPSTLAGLSQLTVAVIPDADFVTRAALTPAPAQGAGKDSAPLAIDTSTPVMPVDKRPDLAVVSVQPSTSTLTWTQPVQVQTTIANKGGSDAEQVRVRFMLVDANYPNDPPLAMADAVVPKLQAGFQQQIVQTLNLDGKLPRDPSSIAARLVVQIDPEHALDETTTTNNVLVAPPVTLQLLTPAVAHADPAAPTTPAPTNTTSGTTTTTGTTPPRARRPRRPVPSPRRPRRRARRRRSPRARPRRRRCSRPGVPSPPCGRLKPPSGIVV